MAKVDKTTVVVQKPVTEEQYVLTLTQEEALAVHSLLGACTGWESDYDTYPVYTALNDALGCPDSKYELYDARPNRRVGAVKLKEPNG